MVADQNLHLYLSFFYLCGHISPCFGWDEEWSRWSVQKSICLTLHINLYYAVTKLFQIQLYEAIV